MVYTSEEIIAYLKNEKNINYDNWFVSTSDSSVHMLLCIDGSIMQGAFGDGGMVFFSPDNKYYSHKWKYVSKYA